MLFSCSDKGKAREGIPSNRMGVLTEEIEFPLSEMLNLPSYYLSSSCLADGNRWVVGYNYRMHALDFMNIETKETFQTGLEKEGDAPIQRPVGLYMHNPDSIWICDQTGKLILLGKDGKVMEESLLENRSERSDEVAAVNTNHAMYTSKLYYNKVRKSLFYMVRKKDAFYVKESFCGGLKQANYYPIALPYTAKERIDTGYGYMNGVNVSFTDERIIYNYPIESVFHVLDIRTGTDRLIESYSAYTRNTVKPFDATNDYSKWERFGLENPHFYEITYLPKHDIYMRLHLKEIEFDKTRPVAELSDSRELFLTCWDGAFRFLCEVRLPLRRYNYYTGWCGLHDGLLLFVNNAASGEEPDETLRIDIIKPDTVYRIVLNKVE